MLGEPTPEVVVVRGEAPIFARPGDSESKRDEAAPHGRPARTDPARPQADQEAAAEPPRYIFQGAIEDAIVKLYKDYATIASADGRQRIFHRRPDQTTVGLVAS